MNRGKPLERRTPLLPGKPLRRTGINPGNASLCRSGGLRAVSDKCSHSHIAENVLGQERVMDEYFPGDRVSVHRTWVSLSHFIQ